MSVETREPANLPPDEAERLRGDIEDAVNLALEAGWNAAQIRSEVDYAIQAYEDSEG